MATAFMRWLETRPGDYDRGIRILTLGRLEPLQQRLVDEHIRSGWDVLEIGCGTGALTVMMAAAGAAVTAIDRSQPMLEQAEQRIQGEELGSRIELLHMDATGIADQFEPGSFDAVVSSLAFSEMGAQEQQFVLASVRSLIRPDGVLLILDEFEPRRSTSRVISSIIRSPLRLLTWLLTRTTTSALHQFDQQLTKNGFTEIGSRETLAGALGYIVARPQLEKEPVALATPSLGRLRGVWTLKSLAMELWALFFRIVPPYPQKEPGLYEIGKPGPGSTVLVTGNYLLTVQRLVRAIDGRIDAWLLVVDSDGINVWCGAGGGFLTAERVLSAWRLSGLDQRVTQKEMVLPELCANGVDGWKIRNETHWKIHWGPVRARDIPAYIAADGSKSDEMRLVSFPLLNRLEMMAATLGFYALMILIPVAIFWRGLLGPLTVSLLALSTFYAITLHWLPGRDGLQKSVPLTGIVLLGMLIYSAFQDSVSPAQLFNRALGLSGLSVFIGAELQGMSPEMRGEQANWGWEALIAAVLLMLYWVIPVLAGWR
jgi:ubiquinone/menaquinone biosynthesis C-methylase UbiE